MTKFRCTTDRYDRMGSELYDSADDFLAMCRACFNEEPSLVEDANGDWHDEQGLVLKAVETVTDTQIRQLRCEAAEAGDIATRILCDMALDGEDSRYDEDCLDEDGRPDYSGGGRGDWELAEIRRVLRLSQDEAHDEVTAMIADAAV